MGIRTWLAEKLNPAQGDIAMTEGSSHTSTSSRMTLQTGYNIIEVVNRGTNLVVDSAAEINVDVAEPIKDVGVVKHIRSAKLERLLNYAPNPYMSADVFKRNIFLDLILDGNAFIYWDGAYLYNLPAEHVTIEASKKTFVKEFKYAERSFKPEEIIWLKDNAADSIYRGKSRLNSAKNSMIVLDNMNQFQQNFFDNSAIPGLVLKTPNTLSDKVKNRIINRWVNEFNPKTGGKRPLILDGEFTIEPLAKYNFKELDFTASIEVQERKILKALGVPPILLDSGNNANITPNLKMFYLTTVMPLYNRFITGFEVFFGYDLKAAKQGILALKPELSDEANYYSTLTNNGIMTRAEARERLRLEPLDDEQANQLILPANIAGSAQDASEGGRPPEENDSKGKDKSCQIRSFG